MIKILQGDCLDQLRPLPDGCVQCCVTSPPYWGLRDYGVPGQIGLEKTPEEYVAKMVDVFREVRRVLRDDGVLWLNLGDSYAGYHGNSKVADYMAPSNKNGYVENMRETTVGINGLKPKDLCGIPWRVAFALQADGWYLRSDIIWHKPNPMPESVTDRPTKAHEYIFLLTKRERYYYDAEAIKEGASELSLERGKHKGGTVFTDKQNSSADSNVKPDFMRNDAHYWPTSRNKRTVWTVATSPYSEAHFATFPEDLIKPCILAGTSAKGCCPKCGAPWERIVDREEIKLRPNSASNRGNADYDALTGNRGAMACNTQTLGWEPGCDCGLNAATPPCTVLDPFGGSGTTGQVALELGRKAILIELNPKYIELISRRTHVTPGLQLA